MFLYHIVQILIVTFLALSVGYIFLFAFSGLFYQQPPYVFQPRRRKIVVLIPGYKEDTVIVDVAKEALRQDYAREYFDVVVIADSFQPQTLVQLAELPIKVIEVSFDKSTKSKALNKAMEQLDESYDIAVILDADNLMNPDFLTKINAAFERNFIAVQGHRTAKNLNTSFAVLDAVSEEINNHIFRKGHRVLGLSSAIIGSGMAFRYPFFKSMMSTVTAVGGFDKELELKMLKDGHTIEYLDDAYIYDEKIQKSEVFSNQRRRWLSAQFHYFRKDFYSALMALITRGNWDYFDKAIQFIQPPRILLLGSVFLFGIFFLIVNCWIRNYLYYNWFWIGLMVMCVLTFLFSVPRPFYNAQTAKALTSLPKGMILMFLSLLKIKGANKSFIHTAHGTEEESPIKPLRIGIEGQRIFRSKKHGMDMVALELIRNLQVLDTKNEYVVFVKSDEDDSIIQETKNFKIVRLKGGFYPVWEQWALPRAALREGCTLLHCTSNTAPIWCPVPLMVTLHDIIYMEKSILQLLKGNGSLYQKFGNVYRRLIIPTVLRKSQHIITVSQFERIRIADFFGMKDDKRLVAVYNGVSQHFAPVRDESVLRLMKQKYGLPDRFFFFLGNTDPKKNTAGTLKAFSDYFKQTGDDIFLVMLDFPLHELNKILQEIGDPALRKRIILTGYIPNEELPAIYSLCQLFLYPSLRESFGIPMLEAMACGAPVITSNTSSMPEVAGNAAIFSDPYLPADITAAMIRVMNDPILRESLIERGLHRAAQFSWRAMAVKVLTMYQSMHQAQ